MTSYFLPKPDMRKYTGTGGKRLIYSAQPFPLPCLCHLVGTRVHVQCMSSEFVRRGSSQTNLGEGLGPDAGAHFEDGSSPLLQQSHVALERPAIRIRAGLREQREKS